MAVAGVGLLRREGPGSGSLPSSFLPSSVSLPFHLSLGVRPLVWLLAKFCAVHWHCASVVQCRHGSTVHFATMPRVCSTRCFCLSRALNSYLLLFFLQRIPLALFSLLLPRAPLGPSPRSSCPPGPQLLSLALSAPQELWPFSLVFLAPPKPSLLSRASCTLFYWSAAFETVNTKKEESSLSTCDQRFFHELTIQNTTQVGKNKTSRQWRFHTKAINVIEHKLHRKGFISITVFIIPKTLQRK